MRQIQYQEMKDDQYYIAYNTDDFSKKKSVMFFQLYDEIPIPETFVIIWVLEGTVWGHKGKKSVQMKDCIREIFPSITAIYELNEEEYLNHVVMPNL